VIEIPANPPAGIEPHPLTYDGLEALMAVEGGTSAAVFQRFVDEHLVPILRPDDVVVMDNLGAHHATGIREAIEAHGARVLYMPAYSPDLNAIELCWSKFKTILKSVGARTGATLREAIRRAARHIRPRDAVAWIDHVLAQLK
jgi:transposase